MAEFDEPKNETEETKKTTLSKSKMIKRTIVFIIITVILIYASIFAYKEINRKLTEQYLIKTFTTSGNLQDCIKMAALNKDKTKLVLKIESTAVIKKIKFVNQTGDNLGELAINDTNIDKILDVPEGTRFLNVSYLNEKDNKILVDLNEEGTYMINTFETEKEHYVALKNQAGIKKVEYYLDNQLYEANLEGDQLLKELYIPLGVEELIVENGFGEITTFNIKDKDSLETDLLGTGGSLFITSLKNLKNYTTIINTAT